MSTHNLCFGSKIRKINIPLQTPVFLYKVGYQGVYSIRTCYRDEYGTLTLTTGVCSYKHKNSLQARSLLRSL